MAFYPIIIVLVLAILDWIAADKGWKPLEMIVKPGTMLALILWMGLSVGWGGPMVWFTIGAIFCLAGDVFLMIPRDLFIFGLIAFLLGHVGYVIGLNNATPFLNWWGILIIIVLAAYLLWLYPKLRRGLLTKGKKELAIPVLVYSLVISLMVYSAWMTWSRPGWPILPALLVSLGAVLFFASDSMLAWDRFLNPLAHARLKVMVTYHLGQIGILVGAMLFAGLK